tara:strand:+ start:75 stop:869 length:795 start_codon:yes stop_codon:yes gene_type:complete
MNEMIEIQVKSTIDGSMEPSLFYCPDGLGKKTLVVGLHTWSMDRFNQVESMLPYCKERNWALLLPEFRGSNLPAKNNSVGKACSSIESRQDIIDATKFVVNNYPVDSDGIFLLGGSGGAHMALMMAAYKPDMWFAVSSWCPITDLDLWFQYHINRKTPYAASIFACCGGAPGTSEEIDKQYHDRSPVSYVKEIAKCNNVFVHHGRYDESVPYEHTINLFKLIESHDPSRFFCEIFDGGHEIDYKRAFDWFDKLLDKQEKSALTG